MALLILQTQTPKNSLAIDSYGVISTAAMLDQDVSVVYCGEGLDQLKDPCLLEQLQTSLEFGVKQVFACSAEQNDFNGFSIDITLISPEQSAELVQQSTAVLSF